MRKILFTLAAVWMALQSFAVPALHVPYAYTQSDGTTIMAYKHGHDYLAFLTTTDGVVLYPNQAGDLCYAVLHDGKLQPSELIAHEAAQRTQSERDFIAQHPLTANDEGVARMARKAPRPRKSIVASTTDGLGAYGVSGKGSVESIGAINIPVIMVEFADKVFTEECTIEKMTRYYNEEGYAEESGSVGSLRDYFVDQSRGMFSPTFTVVTKVTLAHEYAYYGANRDGKAGQDKNVINMVKESIQLAIDQGVDFSEFKVGGRIPLVSFLYAGMGENAGGDDDTIWPHHLDLGIYLGNISGFIFSSYFVGNEIDYFGRLDGIGTFCHEFGHALGLPDFYCTDYNYENDQAFGPWSIMDSGNSINNGRAPIGYTAYERSYLGWLELRELQDPEAVTLQPLGQDNHDFAVFFRNPSNVNEYFILENRQPGLWYPSYYGSGLFVSRFCYNPDQWRSNVLNNTKERKRAMMVTADGSTLNYNESSMQLFGNGAFSKGQWTYFNQSVTNDMGIYKVTKHNDGTITFNFKEHNLPDTYKPTEGTVYELVTDISLLNAEDSVVLACLDDAVALSVRQTSTAKMGACINVLDDARILVDSNVQPMVMKLSTSGNWGFYTGDGYLTSGAKGYLLRTTNKPDASATASITIENGNATIKFLGKNTNNLLRYAFDDGLFCCYPDEEESQAVQIFKKQSTDTGIAQIATDVRQAPGTAYTLEGIKVRRGQLTKGVYIINGRKVVVR